MTLELVISDLLPDDDFGQLFRAINVAANKQTLPLDPIGTSTQFYLPKRLALIPLSEQRRQELKGLGEVVNASDDWYDVRWNGRTLTVLAFGPVLPSQHLA